MPLDHGWTRYFRVCTNYDPLAYGASICDCPQHRRVVRGLPSLAIRASVSLIRTHAGFNFAPSPKVIYPVSPVNAPMALPPAEVVTGRGVEMSVAVMVGIENMAYSVGEYAKHAVSWSRKDIIRAE